jgi:hypothetical protein
MTPIKLRAFAEELTKTAKPAELGTLLGQKVTKTVKQKTKGLAKKAGRLAAIGKKLSAGYARVGKTVRANPKKSMAAGAAAAFAAGRSSKRK